jgi:hypothetical protein
MKKLYYGKGIPSIVTKSDPYTFHSLIVIEDLQNKDRKRLAY